MLIICVIALWLIILYKDPFWGLCALIFLFPFEEASLVPGVSIAVPIGVALVLSYLIHIKSYPIIWNSNYSLFILLVFVGVASLVVNGSYYSNIQSLIQVTIFSFIVSQITTTFERVKTMMLVLGYSLLLNGGFLYFSSIFGHITDFQASLGARQAGLIGDPNFSALFSISFFPPLYAIYLEEKRRGRKLLLGIVLVNLLILFFVAYSRGAIVAVAIMLLITLIFKRVFKIRHYMMLFSVSIAWWLFADESGIMRIMELFDYKYYSEYTMIDRVEAVISGVNMFLSHPFFGVGYGEFRNASINYSLGVYSNFDTRMVAHNSYIEMFAELGILGGIPFVLIMYRSGKRYLSIMKAKLSSNRAFNNIIFSLFLGWTGLMVGQIFLSAQVKKQLWLIVGISISSNIWARTQSQRNTKTHKIDSEII
jgi:O-antigen ligase